MDEAKIAVFKGKVIRGTLALTTRTFLNQQISFIGNFILTIILAPSAFGIFFLVTASINFLNYFSDIGLAAALVQKESEPTRDELNTVFTLQETIVLSAIVIALIFTEKIALFYNLTASGILLYQALILSFFLASLKTIPSILLERRLDFTRLALPQILENSIFYITAVILAFAKMDVLSFAYASVLRGIAGLIAIYWICPWLPGVNFSFIKIKHLINFGIPFQLNSLLALVKDDLLTLYLGKVLPFSSLGLLGWAKKQAEVPLRLIMDSVVRVTFPAFSRIQNDKFYLTKAINKTILYLGMFILPISALMLIYIYPLVYLIPKYIKWLPAVPAFYLFAVSSMLSAFSTPIVNALNALGKIKKTLSLMLFWTILTWILVPLLTYNLGLMGWPISAVVISSSLFVPILILKKFVAFEFINNLKISLILTILISIIGILSLPFIFNILILALFILLCLSLYAIFVWYFFKNELKPLIALALRRE